MSGHREKKTLKWLLPAAVVVLAAVILAWIQPWALDAGESKLMVQADYPQFSPQPGDSGEYESEDEYIDALMSWDEEFWTRWAMAEGHTDGAKEFFAESMRAFLSGCGSENRIYSPLGVYMALAAAAELAEGNSRAQILQTVGAESLEALRSQANILWNACYCDDGEILSKLDSALYLNPGGSYNREALEQAAEHTYVSSYQRELDSEELVFSLLTTFDFQKSWNGLFDNYEEGAFQMPEGKSDCIYLYRKYPGYCYSGENFSAVKQEIEIGTGREHVGALWFILPEEGVAIDEVVASEDFVQMQTEVRELSPEDRVYIRLTMPRFTVSSQLDLTEGLTALGVTDLFNQEKSDFTALFKWKQKDGVGNLVQDISLSVDERGCSMEGLAAVNYSDGDWITDVHFRLNRPFIFVLTGPENIPLLAGVVNQPDGAGSSLAAD